MGTATFTCYQLLIHKERDTCVQVGRLGFRDFPRGYYVYTGSARKNLSHRVLRHVSRTRKLRWHIDYLLDAPDVQVVDVSILSGSECSLNQHTRGSIPAPGFGSSDCREGCGSHLKYLGITIPCDDWPGSD